MASVLNAEVSAQSKSAAGFLRSRLGSFLAVVPLSFWVVNHLWQNLSAFSGASEWQTNVTTYAHPVAQFVTAIVVLLPLALHMAWGVGRLLSSRPNNVKYTYFSNLKYVLQRLSAIGVMLFLGAHLWLAMLRPRLVEGGPEPFSDIAHEMHFHLPTLVVYLLGSLGVAYHLANGLETFAMGWGVVASRRALGKLQWGVVVLFLILLAMAWGAIYALYQAGGAAP